MAKTQAVQGTITDNPEPKTAEETKEKVTQTTAVQVKAPTKAGTMLGLASNDIKGILDKYRDQIAQALPKHLTPERMIQIATTVISQNPTIKECTAASIIGAVMQSSILGFNPSPVLGQCYFVPFNRNIGTKENKKWVKEAQFIIGYKGYIDLSRRGGQLKTIDANIVREHDVFEYEYGLEPKLRHIPKSNNRGEIKYVYAVAHYVNGGFNFVVLTNQEVEMLRLASPMQKAGVYSGAWALNEVSKENMFKAKAVRQLAKYMPLSLDTVINMQSDGAIIHPDNFIKLDVDGQEISAIKPEEIDYVDVKQIADSEELEKLKDEAVKDYTADILNDPAKIKAINEKYQELSQSLNANEQQELAMFIRDHKIELSKGETK